MHMNEKEVMAKIEKMPIEEKLKLLSKTDRAYVLRYIEMAVQDILSVEQHGSNEPKERKSENQ